MSDKCDEEVKDNSNDDNNHKNDDIVFNANETILKCAENGDLLGVRECLERDPRLVLAVDSDRYTPLHRSSYNNHIQVMRLLIQSGADVSARTTDGWTPLHCASKWSHVSAADLLINCGADINAVSNGGNTALHLAANHNNRPLVELFLFNEDTDTTLANESGETAYHIAKRSSPLYQLWHYL
ncbi:unnamed protein product [Medioppia subpectinata]|uniref:Alpha-latrotoxin n=1 Tax=Medioppia subpectinata TaxID=1979941 RepID=A0A7R9KBY3_9ACAR|nr:unnamed protein product [Medioppia subpectinata]CAG2100378.1 unnamed protein product [Medioppia subpectinata]